MTTPVRRAGSPGPTPAASRPQAAQTPTPASAATSATTPAQQVAAPVTRAPSQTEIYRSCFETQRKAATSPPVQLDFGSKQVSSAHSQQVLKEILACSGISNAKISSTVRTAAEQAQAMHENIEATSVADQKNLYSRYGDQVIDTYQQAKKEKKPPQEIENAMALKVGEITDATPTAFPHSAPLNVLNAVDVAPSSLPAKKKADFEAAARAHPDVSKVLSPTQNKGERAYHLEIPQE